MQSATRHNTQLEQEGKLYHYAKGPESKRFAWYLDPRPGLSIVKDDETITCEAVWPLPPGTRAERR